MMSRHTCRSRRIRGSVLVIVLWALAIASLIVGTLQIFAYRQSMLGREVEGRIQARWAARAGVEQSIAVMAYHTQWPVPDDAMAMIRDLEYVATDELLNAEYDIRHHVDGHDLLGPMDEHAKVNVNNPNPELLMNLPRMTPDVVDSMLAWIDDSDEPRMFGAGADWYRSRGLGYEPRNAPFRTLPEIELVAGVWPRYFRGEDWNLNYRLDPNENDGGYTWPEDAGDDMLDAGWSGAMTVYSRRHGITDSGLPRIHLRETEPDALVDRLDITETQAQLLIQFAQNENANLISLLTTPLDQIGGNANNQQGEQNRGGRGRRSNQSGGQASGSGQGGVEPLSTQQLRAVFAETSIEDPTRSAPGLINLNTVSPRLLRDLMLDREHLADEIISLRANRREGIASPVDLLDIPGITDDDLQFIGRHMDVSSNVYTIPARGRSWRTGLEVEMIVVVDRSTIPIRILEYREQ